jgi:hypothetical protein
MQKPLSILAVLSTLAIVGCVDERTYVEPGQELDSGWGMGAAAVRGDVGDVRGIDNLSQGMGYQSDGGWVNLSGNVPHQLTDSSVYVQVDIQNANRLPIGGELRQTGVGDVYTDAEGGEPVMSVYICPNGEGVSGNADEIVVKRIGPESFTFVATSSVPEQNLAIDLGVGHEREANLIRDVMSRPAAGDVATN